MKKGWELLVLILPQGADGTRRAVEPVLGNGVESRVLDDDQRCGVMTASDLKNRFVFHEKTLLFHVTFELSVTLKGSHSLQFMSWGYCLLG